MTAILLFALLLAPVSARAERPAAARPPAAQAQPAEPAGAYGPVAEELLKDCATAGKAVAVVGFSYSDGRDSKDGSVVAERITSELVKLKKVKVTERKEMEKVLAELKLQRSGAIDPASARNIGKMLGADWVVVGTLTELPDMRLELNARLVEAQSGEMINASRALLEKDWVDQYKKTLEPQPAGPRGPREKLESAAIPAFQRDLGQLTGARVAVKIDYDSFSYDEDMLLLVGGEVLPAILSAFKGPDAKAFRKISAIEIKLDNSYPQTGLVKKDNKLTFTITNKIAGLGDNVKFRMGALSYAEKKPKK
jgi:TolB-like protein